MRNRSKKIIRSLSLLLAIFLFIVSVETVQHDYVQKEHAGGPEHSPLCVCKVFHKTTSAAPPVTIAHNSFPVELGGIVFREIPYISKPIIKFIYRRGPPA